MARIHSQAAIWQPRVRRWIKAYHKAVEGEVSAPAVPRLAAARVQLAIAVTNLEAAAAWAERMADGSDTTPFTALQIQHKPVPPGPKLKSARHQAIWSSVLSKASQEGWFNGMNALRALQSWQIHGPEAALDYLKDALKWAQPGRFLRTFVDIGDRLEPYCKLAIGAVSYRNTQRKSYLR